MRAGERSLFRVIKVKIYGVEGFMRLGQEKGHNSCRDNRRYGKFYTSRAEFMQCALIVPFFRGKAHILWLFPTQSA